MYGSLLPKANGGGDRRVYAHSKRAIQRILSSVFPVTSVTLSPRSRLFPRRKSKTYDAKVSYLRYESQGLMMQKSVAYEPQLNHKPLKKSNKTMDLRSYTKQELALLYFPDATPAVASAHLMRWIQRIPDLLQKLAATGYGKNCKEFTPMQVSYILYFLGEP